MHGVLPHRRRTNLRPPGCDRPTTTTSMLEGSAESLEALLDDRTRVSHPNLWGISREQVTDLWHGHDAYLALGIPLPAPARTPPAGAVLHHSPVWRFCCEGSKPILPKYRPHLAGRFPGKRIAGKQRQNVGIVAPAGALRSAEPAGFCCHGPSEANHRFHSKRG